MRHQARDLATHRHMGEAWPDDPRAVVYRDLVVAPRLPETRPPVEARPATPSASSTPLDA